MVETLDISTLVNLKYLDCTDNLLTSLDVSANTMLEYLDISSAGDVMPINDINEIDLSNNPLIRTLIAVGSIDLIDLRNGNNSPGLNLNINAGIMDVPPDYIQGHTCILVDDPTAAQENQSPYSDWTISHMNQSFSFAETCLAGYDEHQKTGVFAYPNPATDMLYIDSLNVSIDKVSLFDVSGRLVRDFINPEGHAVPVNDLEAGVYMVHIHPGTQSHVQKIIVQ